MIYKPNEPADKQSNPSKPATPPKPEPAKPSVKPGAGASDKYSE